MERQSRSAWHGTLLVLGAASLWGLWPVWVRGEAPGSVVAVIAQLVGGLVALPLALARARSRPPLPRAAWVAVLLVGGCNAANTLLYFRGLDEGHVAPVALAHYLAPVLVALLAPRILGEVRSPRTPWALVLALGGTALLLASGHGLDRPGALAAAGMGAGSAVFYASATLIARKISDQIGGVELFAYQALVAALVTLPVVELPALGPAWILAASSAAASPASPSTRAWRACPPSAPASWPTGRSWLPRWSAGWPSPRCRAGARSSVAWASWRPAGWW
jgi:DME family drug/metabolite transporter